MDQRAAKFLTKMRVRPKDILYFVREDRKTVVYLTDGRRVDTYIPVKYLLSALPKGAFLNITKGVVVSAAEILRIESGTYVMSDGRSFSGRRRGAGEHKSNRHALENRVIPEHRLVAETVAQRFSVLDEHILPCCVVQMVLNSAGHGVDFVFRYCNKAMARLEGREIEEILDHSFFEVFQDDDRTWLAIYHDVATNGAPRMVRERHPKTGYMINVYCYQPLEGYCACTMVPGELQ